MDKIRALREIVEIQKNLRIYLQNSRMEGKGEEESLVTIKDFSEEQSEEGCILNLIEEIGDNIEDENLQEKLRKLSTMAHKYF